MFKNLTLYRIGPEGIPDLSEIEDKPQPLIEHLQTRLPAYRFELEASRDYDSFERKIDARTPERYRGLGLVEARQPAEQVHPQRSRALRLDAVGAERGADPATGAARCAQPRGGDRAAG